MERVRTSTSQQLKKQNAQRIDIGHRGYFLAEQLLRTGVVRSHQSLPTLGWRQFAGNEFRRQGLRDSEINELNNAFGRNQYVARLDIAMDHQFLMGIMDGGAYRPEQLDALPDRQAAGLARECDRLTLDVLHHDVRAAILAVATVQDRSDIWVSESRKDLPFGSKPLQ